MVVMRGIGGGGRGRLIRGCDSLGFFLGDCETEIVVIWVGGVGEFFLGFGVCEVRLGRNGTGQDVSRILGGIYGRPVLDDEVGGQAPHRHYEAA